MSKNYYPKAIDAWFKFPEEELILEIVKFYPYAVVRAAERLKPKKVSWKTEATKMMGEGRRNQAIKHCRDITGWGLREAIEAVNALI